MGLFGRERKLGRHAGERQPNTGAARVSAAGAQVAQTTSASLPATAQHLLAMGAPATKATVESVTATGHVVDHDPVVDLVVRLDAGPRRPLPLRTVVPRITVPRQGEAVLLVADPNTGAYLYAGLSL
ncbi:hypothetical protein [Actinokineospora globicatena]|uniref:Uncharacterized protein n=1 Tax=Actinokineospora globicatena TaxID=103729 RepID=A0A9W6QG23_9PSEU|nr:hypothetical protein [Actinokineospora globicatena]MCP2306472.1 hypothetical protein [Actinokineospora globicatena]GLW81901.1 hypothetical protein Aglo01_63820 [Actinokineospora globicatena]GLW88695.1 hypothetical protein Aglo02_63340 [Actinokineospora globicatena]GLW89426.1 hypothetical protein Aglo03_02420 [Actinokineospora globicatena]